MSSSSTTLSSSIHRLRRQGARLALSGAAVGVTVMLAACGGGGKEGATQVAAKVNKEEISVHQINFLLQRQRGIKPEMIPAASRRILDGLVDQELSNKVVSIASEIRTSVTLAVAESAFSKNII